jgi:DNA-binding MarR family transcriptional regulator
MSGLATSVIPLLSSWEKYITDHPDGDTRGFARWILSQEPAPPAAPAPPTPSSKRARSPASPLPNTSQLDDNAQSSLLVARLNGIMRVYSKHIIKDLGFAKDLEFGVLVHVAIMNRPNKKELCRQLLIENSTGVEITRRLGRKGFITEQPDPNDRRSALLSITEKGKKAIYQGYEKLAPFHTSFLDALSTEEKRQLVTLLDRVNQYHTSRLNAHPDFLE